jgi:photosystem II stability/assembly factor-like uncharacterized protein
MVKRVIVFVLLNYLLFFNNCFSQSGWTLLQTGLTDNFTSVHFYSQMYGMAVSSSGKIIKTTNGGLNWTQLNPGISMNFGDIRIISSTNAVAAGRQVSNNYLKILRTTNSGVSWDSVYSIYNYDTNNNFHNLKFFADTSNFGYVSVSKNNSGSGNYLKTVNGGLNWSTVNQHYMIFWNILDLGMISPIVYFCFSYNIFTYQPPPVLYNEQVEWDKTTNDGSTWVSQYSSSYNTQSVNYYVNFQANFYDENTGYITYFNTVSSVYHEVIGRTTNSGQSFSEILIPMNTVSSVFLNSASNIFLTGVSTASTPVVAKSTNSGNNWGLTSFPNTVNKIYFLNPNTGWIACNNGQLYKTTDGGIVIVNNITSEAPDNYSLSQNYPNPFNPITKVKFSMLNAGNVKLIVFDVMGREVQTLVNEKLQPGSYETTFNGTALTSGVYFYKLITDGFTETKRMLMIK